MFVIKVRVEFHFRIIFARYSNPFKVFMRFQSMIFLGLFPRNYFRRFFRKYYGDFASSRKHSGCSFDRLALSFVHARLDTNDYFIFPHVARASRYTTG